MVDNKTNIFDLVEEVNKEKKKSSMSVEKEINDIYSMLDDIKNDNNISVDDVRERINNYSEEPVNANIKDKLENYSTVVTKPELPINVSNYDLYSECVLAFISGVNYGTNNSKEYVTGHKAALEKYYLQIKNNSKDIYVVEGNINEEINNNKSNSSLRDKGYYDGLIYVLKSLKKSKELLTDKINKKLVEKIG